MLKLFWTKNSKYPFLKKMKYLFLLFLPCILFSCNAQEPIDPDVIKRELDSIFVLDQKYRTQLSALYQADGFESDEFQQVYQLQQQIDSSNLAYVEELIQRLGTYPGNSLVGPTTAKVAFYVLQHAPDSIQAKYLDLILGAAQNKELNKGSVAMYHDRYLKGKGEPQIYGTQVVSKSRIDGITGEKTDTLYLWPIRDTNKIDSIRMWNGLPPLETYLQSFGLSRWDFKNN